MDTADQPEVKVSYLLVARFSRLNSNKNFVQIWSVERSNNNKRVMGNLKILKFAF